MIHKVKDIHWCGLVYAPDTGGSSAGHAQDAVEQELVSEQFYALMSLALDDRLSPGEEVEFDRMLAEERGLDEIWYDWRAFDRAFHTAPRVEPPVDFVDSFEARLARQERRRHLWFGAGVSAIVLLLWSGLVVGIAGAGAYVMFNQSGWLTRAVRVVAHATASVESFVYALADAATTALSTPQVQGMAVAYIVFAAFALWFWARFLRRSVGAQNASPVNA